jgi:hypothetical protein
MLSKRWLALLTISLAAACPPMAGLRASGGDADGPEARAKQTRDSLQALGKAMHAYAEKHDDAFPLPLAPLKLEGKEVKLGLSWRVQLLPYLGENTLYEQFKLDEPWDSPANKALLPKMPKVFAPPRVKGTEDKPGYTHYQIFTTARFQGDNASRPIFPNLYMAVLAPKDRPKLGRIADGTRNTILIAEAARAVPWTKPEDLPYAGDLQIPSLGHAAPGVIFVCMADGEVRALSRRAKASDLRALITSFGGEVVDPDDLAPDKHPGREPKTATVSGIVSFKGKPVPAGWITFHTKDEREFSAVLQEDGTYQVAGVPVGPARVTVGSLNDLLPPFVPPQGPKAVVLPRAYADAAKSSLAVEVRQGSQTYDIELR